MGDENFRNAVDRSTLARLYRFGLVGAGAALVQTLLLWALVEHAAFDYLVAAVFAIETTILLQYVANNAWTFRHAKYTSLRGYLVGLARTNVVRGTAIPIQVALLYAFAAWTVLTYLPANGLAILLSGAYRYYLDSRWTWKI